ncbi:MAG: GGDEF domain-containing protein [Microgenomates group bacterium]
MSESINEMPKDDEAAYLSWQKALEEDTLHDDPRLLPDTVSTDEFLRVEKKAEVAEKKAVEAEKVALIDEKTGLPNGAAFQQRLEQFHASHTSGALIIMDLNGLKIVNDEMGGHAVGDHLLIAIATELRLNTSEQDFVARMNDKGGDEFAVLLPGLSKTKLSVVLQRLQKLFPGGFDEQDHLIPTVSIGAVHTDDIGDAERSSLRDCADYAMYKAKHLAKAAPSITEHNMHLDTVYTLRKPTASYVYNPQEDGPVLTVRDALASFQAQPQARLK